MRAVVVTEPHAPAFVETIRDPTPAANNVIVAVRGCGICGTDKHILEQGLPTARYPLIPGHEPWGEVVEVGTGVTLVQTGDIVAVDPSLHCGSCPQCRRGRGNLCERWGAIGGTEAGAWADYVSVPEKNAYVLSGDYPLECASIIEPVACGIRGIARLGARPGHSALIVGGGTMGLILALLLEQAGCEPITVAESNGERRTFTTERTRLRIVDPETLGDLEADYVVDATGVPGAVEAALDRVAPGGTFMVFGVSPPDAHVAMSPFRIYQREITVVGSMAILGTFQPAVETVGRHPNLFRPLLTHSFELAEFDSAVAALSDGNAIKVTIAPTR
jgi:2-desacetyl-2-hydroxyethyl bacteriochlorophyllide A dehydrogenase